MGLVLGSATAASERGVDTAQRVLALERAGRAQPRQSAAELATLLSTTRTDPGLHLEALTVQAWLLASVPDSEAAEAVARRIDASGRGEGASAAQQGSSLAAAAALLVRARLAEQTGDIRRATTLIDAAAARLPADATPLTRLRHVSAQAHIRNGAGKLEDAIRLGHEALKIADTLAVPWRESEARNELAYSYYQANQFEPARSLNDEAMMLAVNDGDPATLAHVSTVQGIIRDALGDTQGEKRSLQAAIEYARAAGAKAEESLYLANVADFYLKNKEYATALRYAQQALPLTRELKNLNGETVALANIGLALIALRDIEAGKRHLLQAIAIDERRGSITGMSDTYKEMGQYLEQAGDLRGAAEALHRHRALSDQILRRDQQQAILEMQEQFAGDRRTRELELLQRDGEIKSEQLRARDLEQGLWWLLATSCLLTLAVVALLLRRVGHRNRQLADINELLKVQTGIDPLTGLANRRHFQTVMRQLAADGKLAGTVFLADIDHFKRINDCWGHVSGDAVLVEVARRLRGILRERDLIVRWGGEEFLVVVRELGPDAVDALAQRMLDVVGGAPVEHEGRVIGAAVSIGYATFPIEPARLEVSWERAIDLVDTAMYLAKAHGRNRAYGVRSLHASDESQFDAVARSLEASWHAGDVSLTPLRGPGSKDEADGYGSSFAALAA